MVTSPNPDQRARRIKRITIVGSICNLLLTVGKFFAGFVGHSGAMIADAVHSLSDLLTDLVVFIFISISGKPSDKNHDYGHGKFETLATAIIAITLVVVGAMLCSDGLTKVHRHLRYGDELARPGAIALLMAFVSIVAKEWLFRVTRCVGKEENSRSVIANAWHHRSDAYTSIATLIGIGGAFLLGRGWMILEPLAAAVVSIFIMKVGFEMALPAFRDLLEQSLPDDIEEEIEKIICSESMVKGVRRIRTRNIGNYYAVEADILVDGGLSVTLSHAATQRIEKLLRRRYGQPTHIVIHVEPFS
ncbi:cation diffusion facilitator family transporter [Porphyromonas gulae]|uniref:cation diffusion facilitator family transporter n=1 Tax=Porphyromonas gulae TaxID=111105 RepID=UPI0026F0D1C2|nr:cation diffusion facilitator family transporter [Porphyromonas gulae]